ncbi:hypothetical protein GTID1_17095 [Geobacillus thermodenitrificans]|uniref:Uncharacterized protein n=1 Tax=Geobacillus thermodenitrificans TaxID=33940 RepID=A0ABY9QA40_GEOTD|nr:DUF6731 family protein [Geobacillus thermodenitrificans]ATO38744.1 hypothetical protein GTID1_17095 [Geobacillus thermodenitrificans]WMV74998.1 hypothetical protein HSX42_11935 [Geobacillus thermodenitrificans]
MSYRKVRFEYYQVVYRRRTDNGTVRDRLFDLEKWMDKAMSLSLEGRTFDYRSEQARLDNAYWDPDLEFYFLHFVRLRDTNIPSKAKADSQVEPFELQDDEYLGEEVSALYDESNHVLMLQRNKYSLGPEGIEEYLNLVWDNEEETIYLRPICPPNVFELARRAGEYRRINLRFADINIKNNPNLLQRLRSPLRNIVSSFGEYQGINAQVIITVGNNKDASLDEQTIRDTLLDIEENPHLFSKAEIAKKDDDDAKVELVDLFAHKAHDFATFRMERRASLNHYTVAGEMWSIYSPKQGCNNRQRDINSYLRS